ncbi:hypothetical protein C8Q72DRAFT_863324 [Fomitopsis betulina]|nr:hypothetical protein C8Q72DRAFT_863324 [Fomitopsis betulina]
MTCQPRLSPHLSLLLICFVGYNSSKGRISDQFIFNQPSPFLRFPIISTLLLTQRTTVTIYLFVYLYIQSLYHICTM